MKIHIIKEKLSPKDRGGSGPKTFAKIPSLLYLELIENKQKIKQDLIDKEYNPKNFGSPLEEIKMPVQEEYSTRDEKSRKRDDDRDDKRRDDDRDDRRDERRDDRDDRDDRDERRDDRDDRRDDDRDERRDDRDDRRDDDRDERRDDRDERRDDRDDRRRDDDRDYDDRRGDDDEISNRLHEILKDDDHLYDDRRKDDRRHREDYRGHDEDYRRDDNDYRRDDDNYPSQKKDKRSIESFHSQSKHVSYDKYKEESVKHARPPTLAELAKQGAYVPKKELRDITRITQTELEDEDKKRELLWKIEMLKKSYPTAKETVPEMSIHTNLSEMQKEYENAYRRVTLDNNVTTYKKYLHIGFVATEYIMINYLKLDMAGFANQQALNMSTYDRLLIEIGETSISEKKSQFPVGVRLAGVVLLNAFLFLMGKMVMKSTGANIMNMMGGGASTSAPPPKQKKKMMGPSIDIDDLPDQNK